jgi:hypothetical protein
VWVMNRKELQHGRALCARRASADLTAGRALGGVSRRGCVVGSRRVSTFVDIRGRESTQGASGGAGSTCEPALARRPRRAFPGRHDVLDLRAQVREPGARGLRIAENWGIGGYPSTRLTNHTTPATVIAPLTNFTP